MIPNHPTAAIDGHGNAVVAWGTRVVTRGRALRRGTRADRIDARIAATSSGRFGALRHADRSSAVSQPLAAPVCGGVLLTWTVREPSSTRRLVRATLARHGTLSPSTTAGRMLGSGSQTVLPLPRGHCDATLLWHDSGLGVKARLMTTDTLRR